MARYYLQISDCREPATLKKVRALVGKTGKVFACGSSPSADKQAGWFEVVSKYETILAVRAALATVLTGTHKVQQVREIDRGEGAVQAKQLNLF